MIGIINCNTGNIANVVNAIQYLGETAYPISCVDNAKGGTKALILPGVGSFGKFMKKLDEANLVTFVKEWIQDGKEFLGICVGCQVLFDRSEESPSSRGLGVLKGEVVKFRGAKTPQIGWNWVEFVNQEYANGDYYFVNSYYPQPTDNTQILATSYYGLDFTSAVHADNVLATQFHPELSGESGLRFLRRWVNGL